MKSRICSSLVFAISAVAIPLHSEDFSIIWHTSGAGGGTSTGGVYFLSGTLGQPGAGPAMAGGSYSLTGGFWALTAVPTPGTPWLKITLVNSNTAVVSWPYPSTGWNLQQNHDLDTTNWITPSEVVEHDGTNNFILVNLPAGNRFYRLFKP